VSEEGATLESTRCLAVVDGGLILTELGPIAYADVEPPRIGMPGSSRLRTINQRLVQDREVALRRHGSDRSGAIVADVWVDGTHVNEAIREAGKGAV
jgi:endonuclease YncB( thermonuclease family)